MNTYRFLVVVENAGQNLSAYSPDLPGCMATGATREDAEKNMYEAIQLHIEGLKEDALPTPSSSSIAEYVVVPAGSARASKCHFQVSPCPAMIG